MPGPVFQNITPTPSSTIDPSTSVSFEVVGDGVNALVLVVPIIAVDPNVAGELVHDWTTGAFEPAYLKNSTRVAITNGFRYTVRRLNGWAAPPVLRAWAVDAAGIVGVL
jgi:hypothetical protein